MKNGASQKFVELKRELAENFFFFAFGVVDSSGDGSS